jgi:hypothetical protein
VRAAARPARLYGALGGLPDPGARSLAMLWVLNLSDGNHSLLDIAERAELPFELVRETAALLEATSCCDPRRSRSDRMLNLDLVRDPNTPFRVLALGAHCDDIEIGCGATLLTCSSATEPVLRLGRVHVERGARARGGGGGGALPARRKEKRVVDQAVPQRLLPDQWAAIKDDFEALKREVNPT